MTRDQYRDIVAILQSNLLDIEREQELARPFSKNRSDIDRKFAETQVALERIKQLERYIKP